MNTILKNIRTFAFTHTAFFLLFQICVFVSSILIFFAFGAYQNFHVMQQGVTERQTECFAYFYSKDQDGTKISFHATQKQMNECIRSFPDKICQKTRLMVVGYDWLAEDQYTEIYSRFQYRNGIFYPNTEGFENNLKDSVIQYGFEGISVDEYNSGENIVQAPASLVATYYPNRVINLAQTPYIYLDGISYEVKIISKVGTIDIPFPVVPDDKELSFFYMKFLDPPTPQELRQIKTAFQKHFGPQAVFEDPEPFNANDYSYFVTITVVSVLIAVAAAANIALLYQYILEKRRRTLAVFMICGCTRHKAFRIFMIEILLLTVFTFSLSALCYHFLIMPRLAELFPYIDTVHEISMYCRAFATLIGSCAVIVGIMCVRIVISGSIVKIQKEGLI